jgi:hypothetical protein
MATADLAFINAEQRCFEWLRDLIADIDGGISGYIGELPITMGEAHALVGERQMWMFAITGQNDTMTANTGQPPRCHKAMATFRAMVATRKTALLLAGRLRSILPDQVAATVQRLDISEGMQLTRDVVELKNDQETGGLLRVWLVEQPMWVQFSNDDEIIGYSGN